MRMILIQNIGFRYHKNRVKSNYLTTNVLQ